RVGAFVSDQLAAAIGEHAQLEAAVGAREESVVLRDEIGAAVRERLHALSQCGHVGDTCFDLDVAGHLSSPWTKRLVLNAQPSSLCSLWLCAPCVERRPFRRGLHGREVHCSEAAFNTEGTETQRTQSR